MSYLTMPFVPAFNLLGLIAPDANLKFYITETTTTADVYADPDLSTSLGSVVNADAFGRFVAIYLDPLVTYRVRLETSLGALIQEADGISGGVGAFDVSFLQGGILAVERTVEEKLRDYVSVKDYGAIGDGNSHPLSERFANLAAAQVVYPHAVALADQIDWAAAQSAHTALATQQVAGISAQELSRAAVFYPEGNYRFNRNVKVKGFQAIVGVGTAYTGGSVVHQLTAATDIFTFYGSANDNTSLGVLVTGMNFEFDSALVTTTGIALNFPKFDDIATSQVLSSNSHYIRDNRFGGWHPKGRFLKMINCNDVEISGNIIDVCETTAMEFGDASDAAVKCTDIRILGNGFYYTQNPIAIRHAHGVTISSSNSFFESFAADWIQIDLGNGGGTVNAGRVEGVVITGNEFGNCHTCLRFDGSVGVITVDDNIMRGCLDYPVVTTAGTDVSGVIFTKQNIKVASTYTRDSWINPLTAKFKESTFADNRVDANGVAALTGMVNEISGGSGFGDGMTLRNNPIFNNASPDFGCFQFLPCTARELAIENIQATGSYPTAATVFTFSTIAVNDSLTFDLDYEVVVDKPATNVATRTGRVRVSLLKLGGSIASDVTSISSVAQDFVGTGGTTLPTVTFAVGASILTVTVTSDIAAPTTVTVRTRAHSFRASGAVLIKSAT